MGALPKLLRINDMVDLPSESPATTTANALVNPPGGETDILGTQYLCCALLLEILFAICLGVLSGTRVWGLHSVNTTHIFLWYRCIYRGDLS
jgi:hypothetical protein